MVNLQTVQRYELSLADVTPPPIVIDGVEYPLAELDDYSVPEIKAVNRMWSDIVKWDQADTMTAKEGQEYDKHLDALVKFACPSLPAEVKQHKNFGRESKAEIVLAFLAEASKRRLERLKRVYPNQSLESSDSTAAVSNNGLASHDEI